MQSKEDYSDEEYLLVRMESVGTFALFRWSSVGLIFGGQKGLYLVQTFSLLLALVGTSGDEEMRNRVEQQLSQKDNSLETIKRLLQGNRGNRKNVSHHSLTELCRISRSNRGRDQHEKAGDQTDRNALISCLRLANKRVPIPKLVIAK